MCYLFLTSNKKAWDWYFKFPSRLEIWQVAKQKSCQTTPVIFQSTCLEYLRHNLAALRVQEILRLGVLRHVQLSESRPCLNVTDVKRRRRKVFWKFIGRKTDYPTCNYGSPLAVIGCIWRLGDHLWTALPYMNPCWLTVNQTINTLRPRQNGHRFAYDTFKYIFLNENVRISIKI